MTILQAAISLLVAILWTIVAVCLEGTFDTSIIILAIVCGIVVGLACLWIMKHPGQDNSAAH